MSLKRLQKGAQAGVVEHGAYLPGSRKKEYATPEEEAAAEAALSDY